MNNNQNKSNDDDPFCFYASYARSYELAAEIHRIQSGGLQFIVDRLDEESNEVKTLLSDFRRHAEQAAKSWRQLSQSLEACAANLQTLADSKESIPSMIDLGEIDV